MLLASILIIPASFNVPDAHYPASLAHILGQVAKLSRFACQYLVYPCQLVAGVRVQGPSISRPVLSVLSVVSVHPSQSRPNTIHTA